MIYLYGYVPFITIKGALNITTNKRSKTSTVIINILTN